MPTDAFPRICCPGPAATESASQADLGFFFTHLFDTSAYPARWNCGSWSSLEGWLHIVSDLGIFSAYFAIPCSLIYFVMKRRDIPFNSLFFLFASFILLCGSGHLLEAVIFYWPAYRLAGVLKLATAIVSWVTFFALVKLLPKALALPGLAVTNEALRQADAAKTQFLANMSHEIRTPMTAILGYAEYLHDTPASEDVKYAARTIKRNAEHLLDIINDILDMSKLETGNLSLFPSQCNPVEILQEVVELMQVRANDKRLELRWSKGERIPKLIQGDPVRLKQILTNLIGNALKFTSQGSVTVSVSRCQEAGSDHIRFAVTDTGIGIPADKLSVVFDPFVQVESSSVRNYEGTGLGLAISQRFARLMDGDIQVESQLHQGSTFTLILPVVAVHEPDQTPVPPPLPVEMPCADQASPLHGLKVLLVEDGVDNQKLVGMFLRKSGAEVVIAENGLLAIDAYEQALATPGRQFDLILMDMQMPVMDGYTATGELRRLGCTLPIIALTAHAMSNDRQKCLAAGCDEYLSKPVKRAVLIEMVASQWKAGAVEIPME